MRFGLALLATTGVALITYACSSSSRTKVREADAGSGGTSGASGSGGTAGDASSSGGTGGTDAGGSGGTGAGGSAGTDAGSGGTDAGGACAFPDAGVLGTWPDSSTAYCSDGTNEIKCTDATGPYLLQDGVSVGTTSSYSFPGGPVAVDSLTGLTWRTDTGGQKSQADASLTCAGQNPTMRLPTLTELISIIDFGKIHPAIDTTVFAAPTGQFWTASTFHGGRHAVVDLDTGTVTEVDSTQTREFRCVSGNPTSTKIKLDCGAAVDTRTGLMWWTSSGPTKFSWTGALTHCDGLVAAGFSDWRLPTAKELFTILEPNGAFPAIDQLVFGTTEAFGFWSSTGGKASATGYGIDFGIGIFGIGSPTLAGAVLHARCVRDWKP